MNADNLFAKIRVIRGSFLPQKTAPLINADRTLIGTSCFSISILSAFISGSKNAFTANLANGEETGGARC